MEVDELDLKILEMLEEERRIPHPSVARKLKSSESAVRKRAQFYKRDDKEIRSGD